MYGLSQPINTLATRESLFKPEDFGWDLWVLLTNPCSPQILQKSTQKKGLFRVKKGDLCMS